MVSDTEKQLKDYVAFLLPEALEDGLATAISVFAEYPELERAFNALPQDTRNEILAALIEGLTVNVEIDGLTENEQKETCFFLNKFWQGEAWLMSGPASSPGPGPEVSPKLSHVPVGTTHST